MLTDSVELNAALGQLGIMLGAGVTADKALATIARPHSDSSALIRTRLISHTQRSTRTKLQQRFAKVATLCAKGVPISKALLRNQCILPADAALLSSAEAAGRLALALQFLGERNSFKQAQVSTLKAGLVLPLAVLGIGLLAGVFIQSLQGTSVLAAIMGVTIPSLFVLLCMTTAVSAVQLDVRLYLSCVWAVSDLLPRLGQLLMNQNIVFKNAFERCFYTPLLWQIKSGISFEVALANNQCLINNKHYQRCVTQAVFDIARGEALPKVLSDNKLAFSKRMQQTLETGDHAGCLEQALSGELAIQQRIAQDRLANLVKWLPRLAYLLVIVVLAKVVL